jgi:nucleotide-binding universal stress UspA family protein
MGTDRDFRVLVATDGSAPAKTAVATAVRFPWPARTLAQGITARQVPADYRRSILLAALDRSAEVIATGARRALSRRWPGTDVTIVDTAPVAGVLHEAKRFDADVIVLGWRGHGAVRRFLMGSVSRGVVRGAQCAVLVVRRGQRDLRRIVIGFDGSVNAQRAVEFVSRLHAPRGGQVMVFRAVDHIGVPSHSLAPRGVGATVAAEVRRVNAQRTARAKTDLARAEATLTRAGWRVRTTVTAGAPLHDLLATVDSAGADLLVVGARGASGVRHLLVGSVAEGALNRCPVPVLMVR